MSLATTTTVPAADEPSRLRDRYFGPVSLQRRVLLSQLPLTLSVALVVVVILLFHPQLATDSPYFAVGVGGVALLTVLAGAVPWDRYPPVAYWVIPLLDFVAIAPLWATARHAVDGMSMLSAFPVVWLAWSGIYPVLGIALGVLGSAGVTWWPYLSGIPPFDESSLVRPILVPFLMLALAVAASVLTRRMARQRSELGSALGRARTQNRTLQTIVDTSDVGIVVADGDGRRLIRNETQKRIHRLALPPGVDDAAEADLLVFEPDGRTPIPPEDRPVTLAMARESFRGRLIAVGAGAGKQQHLSVSASPMYDENEDFDGTVVVFQNVTDLVDAIQGRERFVAEVSHEFRTPLTSIIGYLEMIEDENTDPVIDRYLKTIQRNAERLLGLVTSLLDTLANSTKATVQHVDLARLVRQSVESAAVGAQQSGLALESDLPDRFRVVADPLKMSQVADNLISNAIKYTPGGGSITVTVRHAGEWAELRVADTGIGMTEPELEKIFTNYYRTEHVRRAAIPGTGLGLAITQGFVRAHGGDIAVESTKGVGSVFTARIPVDGPPPAS